jgi:HK97 family phage portal protein
METRGEAFVFLDRGESGTGRIAGMWPIFGDMTVLVDKNLAGEVVGYEANVDGKRVPLLPSEVLWLRYPDAENEWGSIAPLTAAAHAIGLDAHARAWQRNELRNGARPTAVVYLGDLDEGQHEETVAAYRSKIEGAENAGRALFVSSKMPAKVERLSLTPAELGWLDTRRSAWEEIMVSWGVPKDYLLGGATYENRDAARSTLWSDAIIPKLEIVAGELARQLLEPGQRARFDTDDVEALQESADGKVKRTVEAMGVDLMLVDEGRAELGLDPLGNGIGQLTLTAYRAALQLEAQSLLLQIDPQARQLQPVPRGALQLSRAATRELALPTLRTRAGLTFDQAQAEYAHHERVGERAVKRLAAKQEAIVLANLHKLFGRSGEWAVAKRELDELVEALKAVEVDTGVERREIELQLRAKIDKLLDAEKAQAMTREQLEDFLAALWSRGGEVTAEGLGISFDTFHESVLDAMADRSERLAEQITETTRAVLEEAVLVKGVAEGESVDELAARVRSAYSDLSTWRATMIARTETVGGFNGASFLTARESGVVTARVWLATGDSRTRDSHIETDGERLTKWDALYRNGCLHPGNGPASETIMCRCVEVYEAD